MQRPFDPGRWFELGIMKREELHAGDEVRSYQGHK